MNNINKKQGREKEDATKYGEFVSSFFSWLTLDGQKEKAKELENTTKKEIKNKN